MELKVNQIVFLKPVGNNARRIKDNIINHIEEWKIRIIGRKYITVSRDDSLSYTIKFDKEDRKQFTNYGSDWELFFSIQDIKDNIETDRLSWIVKNFFSGYGNIKLSLEKLRKIQDIINEESEEVK